MDARDALGEPTATISRSALLHNASLIRREVPPGTKLCAVVKADGYGHGAELVVDALANFSTHPFPLPAVDAFAVADLDEAADLPEVEQPVMVLRPVENSFLGMQRARLELAIRRGWWLTVVSGSAADDVARIAERLNRRAHIHIMVDTGLNRVGVHPDGLDGLLARMNERCSLHVGGLYTHLVNAEDADDPVNIDQIARFLDKTDPIIESANGKICRHVANSGGIFFSPAAHLDMVRPGLALYGIDPTGKPSMDRRLRPVLRWTAPLIGIRNVRKGDSAGYGHTWTAPYDTRLGLLPVGYADGYPREFSNRAVVMLHGCVAPVVGRISMDLATIDLAQVPMAQLGDEVVLMDNDPLSPVSVYRLAEWSGTIPYEVFCRIGRRVKRLAIEPTDAKLASKGANEEEAGE